MKLMKRKDIIIILILLFIGIAAWIGSNIYHSAINSTISETINQDILPIAPVFDTEVINKLKQRQEINPSFELEAITENPEEASQEGQLVP